jgi:hypothetical protein
MEATPPPKHPAGGPQVRNRQTVESTKRAANTSEVEIDEEKPDSEFGTVPLKSLPARQPRLVSKSSIFIRAIIWTILIGLPLLFISELILSSNVLDNALI